VDWNEVIKTCKAKKHYAKTRDWKKRTPLHLACLKNPPIEALKALVKADRSALSSPDDQGLRPIDYICQEDGSSVATLDVLIRFCPESILVQDQNGCTLLHRCCDGRKGLDFFMCLLDADNDVALLRDRMRRTALHVAVMQGLDTEIIERLIVSAPRTVGMEDVRGYYPLHYACSYIEFGMKTFRFLLEKDVRVSRVRGNNGFNCLEILTRTHKVHLDGEDGQKDVRYRWSKDEVHMFNGYIRQYWEKAILLASASGPEVGRLLEANVHDVPSSFIHDMIRLDRCPPILISLALAIHPDWVTAKDENGNLPLHTASLKAISRRCTTNHVQIIRVLLDRHPGSGQVKNNNGKYPLNLAIESGKRWVGGLQDIFDAFPEAIDSLNLDTRLYAFVLAKSRKDVSKMFKMVTLFPNLMPS